MKVAVVYASKHGFTKGIAEFIRDKIQEQGVHAEALEVDEVRSRGDYDAFVVGSAVYMGHWMKEAKQFIMENRGILASRPVWLFSSGPLGTQTKDAQGRDLREVSLPKETDELREVIKPRDHRVFFGGLDASKLGFSHRMMRKLPAARALFPEGDFRDWKDIEAWANSIALALEAPRVASESGMGA